MYSGGGSGHHGWCACLYRATCVCEMCVLMHTCARCPQDGVVIGASTRSRGPCYQAYASKLGEFMREPMYFSRVDSTIHDVYIYM